MRRSFDTALDVARSPVPAAASAGIQAKEARFVVLDSWRGICAVLVSLHHINISTRVNDATAYVNVYLFVDFFFVLSGFVIAHSYGDKIPNRSAAWGFMLKRIGRLWPLHICVLAVLFLAELAKLAVVHTSGGAETAPFTGRFSLDALVIDSFLLQSLFAYPFTKWNGPAWSISAELMAYVVFVAIALVAPRWRLWLAAAVALLSLVVLAGSGLYLNTSSVLGLFRCFLGFFCGVCVYAAFRKLKAPELSECAATMIEAAFVLGVVISLFAINSRPATLFVVPLFCAAVFVFAYARGRVSQILRHPALIWLGMVSYSIYMVNVPLVSVLFRFTQLLRAKYGVDLTQSMPLVTYGGIEEIEVFQVPTMAWAVVCYIAYIACILFISYFSYRLIEEPGRAWFRALAGRTRLTPANTG